MTDPAAADDPYKPIGCADYEYLELACIDRYQLDVVTEHGVSQGLAADLEANSQGEFLVIKSDDGTRERVRVDRIKKIIVRSDPRRFDEWVFAGPVSQSQ